MKKKISLLSLILLVIAAIDSMRNLSAAALFGSSLMFFFILGALIFLIPTSLIAAELSAAFPNKGGIYHWVHKAFGEKTAMLSIWLQWINTMVWYPTILSFIAGTAAYLFDPTWKDNTLYLVGVILTIFWVLTFINMFGLSISAKVNNLCVLIGTIFPLLLLVVLGCIWVLSGEIVHISLDPRDMLPSLGKIDNWTSLVAIMASFLGMELSGVHVNEINNPKKNFPKALFAAASFILISMLFGSLAIAIILPEKEINLVAGVMQVFSSFFEAPHLRFCIPILTSLIVIGSTGGLINWLIAPAKGLLHAAEFGFMPQFFSKVNRYGAASRILLAQAILVSLFCLAFLLVPSINGFYWFLTALSTGLYMMMYILMFLSSLKLHYTHKDRQGSFKIPGKSWGLWTTSLLGLFGSTLTIIVSFFLPEGIDIGSPKNYILMIAIGNIVMISPVGLFYWYKHCKKTTVI